MCMQPCGNWRSSMNAPSMERLSGGCGNISCNNARKVRKVQSIPMQLVEQHRIDRHDRRFAQIDAAAFASKNLYNSTLYLMRQRFIQDQTIISYGDLDKLMQVTEQYRDLPAKVAQWVLKQVIWAWKSYQAACAAWNA